MQETIFLIGKEFQLEFRQKHALAGVFLFVICSVFVCFLSFEELKEGTILNPLLWLVALFSAFHAMNRTFSNEGSGTQIYLYSLAHPRAIIFSKAIFNALLVALLIVVALALFLLFFGMDSVADADLLQLATGLVLGSTGLGITLTLIAGIAFKAGNQVGLMAILGFPVIIPLLLTLVKFTELAMNGMSWESNALNLLILLVLNGSSLVLCLVLFPYLWRD